MGKKTLVSAAVVAALAASLSFIGREDARTPEGIATSYLEDVRITNKKTGQLLWEISTRRVDLSEEGSIARMEGVAISLPKEGLDVRAEVGIYNMETSHLRLEGGVEARGESLVINTGFMELDSNKEELSTSDKVTVEGKNFKVNGRGLRALGQKVWLEKDVEASML